MVVSKEPQKSQYRARVYTFYIQETPSRRMYIEMKKNPITKEQTDLFSLL
jgi:hypothetical protein